MKRIITFTLVVMAVWALETWWLNSRQANTSTTFALQQLDGSNADATRLRQFEAGEKISPGISGGVTPLSTWVCFSQHLQNAFAQNQMRGLRNTSPAPWMLWLTRLTGLI